MKSIESLDKLIKERTNAIVEDRIKQWAEYYFQKELLPSLIEEIKADISVVILNQLDRAGFTLDVSFNPKGKNEKT